MTKSHVSASQLCHPSELNMGREPSSQGPRRVQPGPCPSLLPYPSLWFTPSLGNKADSGPAPGPRLHPKPPTPSLRGYVGFRSFLVTFLVAFFSFPALCNMRATLFFLVFS